MMALAMEVLPVPGGPQKTREGRRSHLIAERRSEFGASKCSWPTTSFRVLGRIRSDKGSWLLHTEEVLGDGFSGTSSLRRLESESWGGVDSSACLSWNCEFGDWERKKRSSLG